MMLSVQSEGPGQGPILSWLSLCNVVILGPGVCAASLSPLQATLPWQAGCPPPSHGEIFAGVLSGSY